jgi:hypothetical protein
VLAAPLTLPFTLQEGQCLIKGPQVLQLQELQVPETVSEPALLSWAQVVVCHLKTTASFLAAAAPDATPPVSAPAVAACTSSHSYCECFASGRYCDSCNCLNCLNNKDNEAVRQSAVESILERNPNAFRPKIQVRARAVWGLLGVC